jgi:hypothetical protein
MFDGRTSSSGALMHYIDTIGGSSVEKSPELLATYLDFGSDSRVERNIHRVKVGYSREKTEVRPCSGEWTNFSYALRGNHVTSPKIV